MGGGWGDGVIYSSEYFYLRSTTVYLADRRYDMLPGVLSANICSLLSNVNRYMETHLALYNMVSCFRYAVSTIWELDKDLIVTKVWYGRTVIRSAYKMTYEVCGVYVCVGMCVWYIYVCVGMCVCGVYVCVGMCVCGVWCICICVCGHVCMKYIYRQTK